MLRILPGAMRRFWLFGIAAAFITSAQFAGCPNGGADSPITASQTLAIQKIVRAYLQAHPEVVVNALREAQKQAVEQQAASVGSAVQLYRDKIYNDPESPILGNPKGSITIVEFYDYQCPYCKASAGAIDKLVQQNPGLRVVMKEFPVLPSPSEFAARVALVAAKYGKFSAYHDAIYGIDGRLNQGEIMAAASSVGLSETIINQQINNPTITAEINQNILLASKLSINGTPTFLIGGNIVSGAVNLEVLDHDISSVESKGKS